MQPGQEWERQFHSEISQAELARSKGNEGKARVCARRAAGIVLGEYFRRNHIAMESPSALDRLRFSQVLPELPGEALEIIEHFLMRVNSEYRLPMAVDLLAEARQLKQLLLDNRSQN